MNLFTLARDAMTSAQKRKAEVVTAAGIGEPLTPSIVLVKGDNIPVAAARFDWEDTPRALVTIRSLVMLIDCDAVAITLETFNMNCPLDEVGEAVHDYAQAFANGDQRIQEAIMVYAADREGNDCTASAQYTYRGRTVEFSPTSLTTGTPADGSLSKTLRWAFTNQTHTPCVEPRYVGEMLGVTMVIADRTQ